MSWIKALIGPKKTEAAFDPDPGYIETMPARPYRVLHADLPFYSDPECRMHGKGKGITAAVFPGPNSIAKKIVRRNGTSGTWTRSTR